MENLFNKRKDQISEFNKSLEDLNLRKKGITFKPKEIPNDLMVKCSGCGKLILQEEYALSLSVCPHCNHHHRLKALDRLFYIMDPGYKRLFKNISIEYPDFPDYEDKIKKAKESTNIEESVICVSGKICGIKCLVAVMDSFFMMGSMGSYCGEVITRLAEKAKLEHLPIIIFAASGGARMQEGIISLFQMAKTSQAIAKFREKELYIAVLTDPTTGGVSASFASLADITIAEPKALIGFAGKRVIEKTINETLPDEFQTSEFLLEHGYIDRIVERKDLKEELALLLRLHNYK